MEKFGVEAARQWTQEAKERIEADVYASIYESAIRGKDSVTIYTTFENEILKTLRSFGFTVLAGTEGQTTIKWKEEPQP